MAKRRNKKNSGSGSAPMELSTEIPKDLPQPMDTTEGKPSNPALNVIKRNRKMKGGIPVKRSKNLRKQKAMEKAISISEKSEEKILRNKSRVSRIQSAKSLYD
ncbi:hypothetical protein QJS10_CPB11g00985 [Acorus calamus]|uniref:Uncharacterized protein n=1 Tax=Acorus calamus TaxID=4465 RepID=A0AAV9DV47_ACOCL|nr:hypothetical protein QJS10_CPB11g00985 [Acorus calamus]